MSSDARSKSRVKRWSSERHHARMFRSSCFVERKAMPSREAVRGTQSKFSRCFIKISIFVHNKAIMTMIVICKRIILKFYPFLIIKIGTFIIELNIDNDRGTDTRSLEPGNRSRGYGDTDSLYGWQIDHIVPQSLLRDRGFGESMIRETCFVLSRPSRPARPFVAKPTSRPLPVPSVWMRASSMDPQKGEMTLIEIARARGLSPCLRRHKCR